MKTKLIFKIVGYEFDTPEQTEEKQNELIKKIKEFHENTLIFIVPNAEQIEIIAITD